MVKNNKECKLLMCFKNGEKKTFRLNNNIKNVALQSYGKSRTDLYLTLKNNELVLVERLSHSDAEQLKGFLEMIRQNRHDLLGTDGQGKDVPTGAARDMISKPSWSQICNTSDNGEVGTDKENETSAHPEIPSFTYQTLPYTNKKSPSNQQGKTKAVIVSDSEMSKNEKLLNPRRNLAKTFVFRITDPIHKKQIKSEELKPNKKFTLSLMANCNRSFKRNNKNLTKSVLGSNRNDFAPAWDEFEMFPEPSPDKTLLSQGLPNLGNTCYMNAVLQSLGSIPFFTNNLLRWSFLVLSVPHDALSMYLIQLLVLKDTLDLEVKEELLTNIRECISAVAEAFSDDRQSDAHEFLSFCLDHMKQSLQKLNMEHLTKNKSKKENSPQQLLVGEEAARMVNCPVITNFEYELLRSIFCICCGQIVHRTEPSNYLSINLPQGDKSRPFSVQSGLDLFFEAEELEYKCENCVHKRSLGANKFSRLPRILIIHLKRYSLNEHRLLTKDEQEVIVSKYLNLSFHCTKDTKPPVPLGEDEHVRDLQLLKKFQQAAFEITPSSSSGEFPYKFKNSSAQHVFSANEGEGQVQTVCARTVSVSEQKNVKKHSKQNAVGSKPVVITGDREQITKEQLASSVTLKHALFSLTEEDTSEPTSSAGLCPPKAQLQEVPENPKLKQYGKTNTFEKLECDSVSEISENFSKNKKDRIVESCKKVAIPTVGCDEIKITDRALKQVPQGLVARSIKNFRSTMKLSLHANSNSENTPNKSNSMLRSKSKEPEEDASTVDPHFYRLIGVISHIGNNLHTGHYVSDAFNFNSQLWFTYNDSCVTNISETMMQKARLSTGYIFFYMHNEIFKELLERGNGAQSCSTRTGKTQNKQKERDTALYKP
ncbi:ubiquitin carboxyl-terminal hydrolase 26 [Ctenodactylus gundi]